MRILFIVQGEGRGHLTQAIALEKLLSENGHTVVEVLVGKGESRRLPGFFNRSIHAPIRHFISPNFMPTPENKRANLNRSFMHCLSKLPEYMESMCYINRRIKETGADLIINFYELLTGFVFFFFRPTVPLVCIGHQYLFLHKDFELPKTKRTSLFFLKLFTRLTSLRASSRLALSFYSMCEDKKNKISVVPPILRQEVFEQEPMKGNYIHGYMVNSGFADYVYDWHLSHKDIPLRFFWDRWEDQPIHKIDETLSFYQLDDVAFLQQMAGCKAYASTAGFESICEAMYLKKPILMVPAHIEQECNAFDAMKNGAGIIDETFNLDKILAFSEEYKGNTQFAIWVQSANYMIINEIEKNVPQDYMEHMYMVEEFV